MEPAKFFKFKDKKSQDWLNFYIEDESKSVRQVIDEHYAQHKLLPPDWQLCSLMMVEGGADLTQNRTIPHILDSNVKTAIGKYFKASKRRKIQSTPEIKSETGKTEAASTDIPTLEISGKTEAASTPSYYNHNQTDSNNFQIQGSDNVAGNTTGAASRVGNINTAQPMKAPVQPTASLLPSKAIQIKELLNNTEINSLKYEAQIHNFDTKLLAAPFSANLVDKMKSIVKIDNLCFIKAYTMTPAEIEAYTDEFIKTKWSPKNLAVATAFIVAPNLLLTNWHVFPSYAFAGYKGIKVIFDYDTDDASKHLCGTVDRDLFYHSNRELDYCLIGFKPSENDKFDRITIPLCYESTESILKVDNRLTIIQHPGGKLKHISIDGIHLKAVNPDQNYILYTNDTECGSSGSPVFTRSLEKLVALHHSSVTVTDAQVKEIKKNLGLTFNNLVNEGIFISAIFADLMKHLNLLKADSVNSTKQIQLLMDLLTRDPELLPGVLTQINSIIVS